MPTIQIADKPTLDSVYNKLQTYINNHNIDEQCRYNGYMQRCNQDLVLPYNFENGCAVVWANGIHILGGTHLSSAHYSWDGNTWTFESTLPYNFENGCAVVWNDEIHILGGTNNGTCHYKYNGITWEQVSSIPYEFENGSAIVCYHTEDKDTFWDISETFNDIHILGGTNSKTSHYKFDGESWISVSTLAHEFSHGEAYYDPEYPRICLCGGIENPQLYDRYSFAANVWNNTSTNNMTSLDFNFVDGSIASDIKYTQYNNQDTINYLFLLGSSYSEDEKTRFVHYNINMDDTIHTLPFNFYNGSAVFYNNVLYALGGTENPKLMQKCIDLSVIRYDKWYDYNNTQFYSSTETHKSTVLYNNQIHMFSSIGHYVFDNNTWIKLETNLPFNFYGGTVVVYDNKIHIMSSLQSKYAHYAWDGTTWASVSSIPCPFYRGQAVVYNNEIHLLGGSWYPTYHYKWDGTTWTKLDNLPIQLNSQGALVYNNEIHIFGGCETTDTSGKYLDKHYKWDGVTWTEVSSLPMYYSGSSQDIIVYNDKIYFFVYSTGICYTWDGTEWTETDIGIKCLSTSSLIVYNEEIHIPSPLRHLIYHNSEWIEFKEKECITYTYLLPAETKIFCDKNQVNVYGDNNSTNSNELISIVEYDNTLQCYKILETGTVTIRVLDKHNGSYTII